MGGLSACTQPTPQQTASGSTSSGVPAWKTNGNTPLSDARVRTALKLAIDMPAIIDSVFQGKATEANSMTIPGDWLATDLKDYKYDPEQAKALLAEAQWPADYTIDLVTYYADQQTTDFLTVIQQYWQAVGVKMQFRLIQGDTTSQLWVVPKDRVNGPSEVKWDIAYAAKAALVEYENYSLYSSSAPNNSFLPKVDQLDTLLSQVSQTVDTQGQIAIFKQIQKVVNDNMYDIPLYHQIAFAITSNKIDTKGNTFGNDQFYYNTGILDWTTTRSDNTLYTNGGPQEFFQQPTVNPGLFIYQDLVFDRLIDADYKLNPTKGKIAESYQFSSDNKTFSMKIRDGLTWQDGQPLTPADVQFSLELYTKIPTMNAIAAGALKALTGAQDFIDGKTDHIAGITINGSNMELKFDTVSANLLNVLSQWPILPQHLLGKTPLDTLQQDPFWQKPIGSGPYKVDEVVIGNYATLVRWDGYFQKGSGNINRIYMTASTENDANVVKNAGGDMVDYVFNKNVADAIAVAKIPNMKVTDIDFRYTRVFYVNQFPHTPNIK